jgi:NCS1 family nucleobase:cation symporter-1
MENSRHVVSCRFISDSAILTNDINNTGSAIGFLNFMGGYTVFLGPICSIMIIDVGAYNRHQFLT